MVVTSILEICSIELQDQGDYACRATLPGSPGYDVAYFNITVVDLSGRYMDIHICSYSARYFI